MDTVDPSLFLEYLARSPVLIPDLPEQKITFKATPCSPPETIQVAKYSVAKVRDMINQGIWSYANEAHPDYILLIKAPPGTGKTYAGAMLAHKYWDHFQKRVAYLGPRHDFFVELLTESRKAGYDPLLWLEWLTRQIDEENPERTTCLYPDQITTWLEKGYTAKPFCDRACGMKYYAEQCKYVAQGRQPHPIIYGNHNHIVNGHPLASKFGLVIGDEDPLTTFATPWHIKTKELMLDMPEKSDLRSIVHSLADLSTRKFAAHGPELLAMLLEGTPTDVYQRIHKACSDFNPVILADPKKVSPPRLGKIDDVDDVPANYLPALIPLLKAEAQAALEGKEYPHRIYVNEKGMSLLFRRPVQDKMPKHVIWFDATGQPELYEQMFQRPVKVIDANVELLGNIHQVISRNNSKTSLIRKADEEDAKKEPIPEKVDQLKLQIQRIAEQYNSTALITFKDIKDAVADIKHANILSGHFYANRGSNLYENVDAIIVAGTPQIRQDDIETYAKCLWQERMEPFNTEWHAVNKKYPGYVDADGNGWEYPVQQFKDNDLNKVLWHFREAEVIQAIHRARIIIREAPAYLLSSIPIDELPPSELITISDLLGVPKGVNPFRWQETEQAAYRIAHEKGIVTRWDLVNATGCAERTARTYMKHMVDSGRWEETTAIRPVASGPGRPPAGIKVK